MMYAPTRRPKPVYLVNPGGSAGDCAGGGPGGTPIRSGPPNPGDPPKTGGGGGAGVASPPMVPIIAGGGTDTAVPADGRTVAAPHEPQYSAPGLTTAPQEPQKDPGFTHAAFPPGEAGVELIRGSSPMNGSLRASNPWELITVDPGPKKPASEFSVASNAPESCRRCASAW